MTIDCTLDNLKIPALPTYVNEFGTKKPTGGLTTAECADDAMLPFRKMRPYEINEDAETTEIQHNAVFVAKAENITLTLHDCSDSFLGCEARVINVSSGSITVKGGVSGIDGGTAGIIVPAKREVRLIFLSDGWHSSYDNYCNITEKEIASSAVTTAKLDASAVTTDKINTSAVTTDKIADANVTESKIAENAVTEGKIATNAVTTDKIKDASVTNDKIGEVLSIEKGGTAASTATQAINNLATGIEEFTELPSDAMGFITTRSGIDDFGIFKRSGAKVWEWIKSKIETVLGLNENSLKTKTITASGSVTATKFTGNLNGNADSATAVLDYGNTSKKIKIGYAGASLTSCSFLAAYNSNGTAIKDIAPANVTVGNAENADTVDGHHFNWAGQSGQPAWLWGGNDSANQYVYNPENFSVNYANSAGSVEWDNVTEKPHYITGSYLNGVLNLTTN